MPLSPRLRSTATALLLLAITGAVLGLLAVRSIASPLAAAPSLQQGEGPSPCVISGTKRASPMQALFGEPISITMAVEAACPNPPMHLVLVLDGSDAMSSGSVSDLRRAGQDLVRELDLDNHPERQLGVVVYNDEANAVCQLTSVERIALRCFDRLTGTGGRDIGAAIEEGRKVLVRGRPSAPPDTEEIMILLAAGEDDQGCSNVTSNAGRTKSQNVSLATICLGQDCDAQCLNQAASSRRLYAKATRSNEIRQKLDDILDEAAPAASDVASAALVDPLGAKVGLVPGSAAPPATAFGPDGRRPEWRFAAVPAAGITVTLVVTPTAPGFVSTNAGATWTITDTDGLTSTLRLPNPQVLVLGGPGPAATATSVTTPTATTSAATGTATIPPSATATPVVVTATTMPPEPSDTPTPPDGSGTVGPPTATGTPGPPGATVTPVQTLTPTAAVTNGTGGGTYTPSPTPTPYEIYLPYLDRGAFLGFDPNAAPDPRLDTVILLEIHRDMQDQKVGLKRAYMQFARNLFFADDQAPRRMGLVTFGGTDNVTCPVQEDIDDFESCLERALEAAPAGNGDLAGALTVAGATLDRAAEDLQRAPAQAIVALAFKERPEGCAAALTVKDSLVARGMRLITLCPGDGCERTCLRDVASARVDYIVIQSLAQLLPFLNTVGTRLLGMGAP